MSSYRAGQDHVPRASSDERFSHEAHGIAPKISRKISSRHRKLNSVFTNIFWKCLPEIYPGLWYSSAQVHYEIIFDTLLLLVFGVNHIRSHICYSIKLIFRFLELPPVSKSLETLIDHMGVLYKFHDRPISYLYNTLHYYELRVRDRAMLKKKLISNIVGKLSVYYSCVPNKRGTE